MKAVFGELGPSERLLLKWLDGEDFSPLGECQSRALDVLIDRRLAWVQGERVKLTNAGRAALADAQEERK